MEQTKVTAAPSYGYRTKGDTIAQGTYLNGAIYGDYGAGKTYLAGSIDKTVQKKNQAEPPTFAVPEGVTCRYATLYANAESGEDGLPEDCPGIVIKDINNYKDFSQLYNFLKLHCRYKQQGDVKTLLQMQAKYFNIPSDQLKELWIFEAVVIDSLTEIQKYCLYQLMGLSAESQLDEEPEYMQQRQWGTALEMILLMIRQFRALKLHTIFVVQQMEDQDERKRLFYRPALQGQAKASILGFFDFVGYYVLQVGTDAMLRRLYLLPVGPFKAKHRFERFKGSHLDNPSFEDILAARAGSKRTGK